MNGRQYPNDFVINSIDEARVIAKQFIHKTRTIYQELYTRQQPFLEKPENAYEGELLDSGCRRDRVVTFNHEKCSHHAAIVFTNDQKISVNLNITRQFQLLYAYQTGDWNNQIFDHPLFLETAFALYATGRISDAEFETLLIFNNARTPLNEAFSNNSPTYKLEAYKILDSKYQLTEQAKLLLVPRFRGFMYQDFNRTQIANFEKLAQAFIELHPGENVFFIAKSAEYAADAMAAQMSSHGLHATMYVGRMPSKRDFHSGAYSHVYQKIVLSCLMENALQLACFHLNNVVFVRSIAGDLSVADIDRCVELGLRPGAVSFGNIPRNKEVHGYPNLSASAKRDHDFYHAQTQTRSGYTMNQVCLRIRDLSRELLKNCERLNDGSANRLFSRVTWKMVDGEFSTFNSGKYAQFIRSASVPEIFCKAFHRDTRVNGSVLLFRQKGKNSSIKITDLGIVTFVDMALNREAWLAFGFDPELLVKEYKLHYENAKELKSLLRPNDLKFNILLYRCFLLLGAEHKPAIVACLEKEYEQLSSKLVFKRNNLIDFLGLINIESGLRLEKKFATNLITLLIGMNAKGESYSEGRNFSPLFNGLLILHIYTSKFPYIRTHVIAPLKKWFEPLFAGQGKDINLSHLQKINEKLSAFIEYHKSKNTNLLSAQEIQILAGVGAVISGYQPLELKKGFLL